MMTSPSVIRRAVERDRETILSTLCELVRINTVNPYSGGRIIGGEKSGQEYLEPHYRSLGLRTRLQPVREDVYEQAGVIGPSPRDFSDRPNLLAEIEFSQEGPHLFLFAHMDTVAVDGMTVDPFDPVRKDGRIYGRGSSDDKSGQTVALHAIRLLLESGADLRGRLTFASVVDEECDGGGAGVMSLLLNGLKPDLTLCLDGSGAFLGRGCNGVITGRIQVSGVSAHASSPDGVSALEKALAVKEALDEVRLDRQGNCPQGLLNLGVLRTGSHPAMVPGAAEMLFNLSYLQSEAEDARRSGLGFNGALLRRRLEEAVQTAADRDEFLRTHPPQVGWVKDLPPFLTPEDSPGLSALRAAYTEAVGRQPTVAIAPYWSDAAIVALLSGCEVIGFGSGAGCAHAPDEYVEEETLLRHTAALAHFLQQELSPRGAPARRDRSPPQALVDS